MGYRTKCTNKNELVDDIGPTADMKSGEEECQEGMELLAKEGTPLKRYE